MPRGSYGGLQEQVHQVEQNTVQLFDFESFYSKMMTHCYLTQNVSRMIATLSRFWIHTGVVTKLQQRARFSGGHNE